MVEDRDVCRFCHEGDHLIAPCHCKGSVKYLHLKCMEKWLESRETNVCELCHHEFQGTSKTFARVSQL